MYGMTLPIDRCFRGTTDQSRHRPDASCYHPLPTGSYRENCPICEERSSNQCQIILEAMLQIVINSALFVPRCTRWRDWRQPRVIHVVMRQVIDGELRDTLLTINHIQLTFPVESDSIKKD